MKRAQLNRLHPEVDGKRLERYRDLFVGGEQFERNVKRYLAPNDREPSEVYERRCKAAHYLNYCKPIGGYFASLLFSKELAVRTKAGDDVVELGEDDSAFLASVDGKGTALASFLRRALLEAMQVRSSYFRVDFPHATGTEQNQADWESAGAGQADFTAIPREALINWRSDDDGWIWVMHYDRECVLVDPGDEQHTITETWTCYYRDGSVRRWQQVRLEKADISDEDVIAELPAPFNPTKQIPIVELALPDDLWLMGHLASPQLEHFRKRHALSWSIERTCFAMPWFKLKSAKKPPTMGTGYYGILGVDEDVIWPTPPDTPFEQVAQYAATLKDELHRVSTTMARGVDNNAAAVGRSGESKQADEQATEIVLDAFGRIVMRVAETAMRMRDRGLGRDREWSGEGLSKYSIDDPKVIAEAAMVADALKIPSVTFRKLLMMRVAKSQLPNLSPDDQRLIAEEIEDNVTPEDVLMMTKPVDPAEQQEPGGEPDPTKE